MNGAETGTETGALTEADAAAEAQPHEPVERAGASCRPIPPPRILHARLQLKSVTFSGGHDIDNDTFGNFPTPHFLVGRRKSAWPRAQLPAQYPYAITRGKKLSVVAVFTVKEPPTGAETVKIDGEAVVHLGCTLKFSGDVAVTPSSKTVTTRVMESDVPLPNAIHRVEPLTINWFQTPVDKARHPAGSSANTLYLTLNTPTTTPLYWTLLEVSCVWASGATDITGLRSGSFDGLKPCKIKRMRDNRDLSYWGPPQDTSGHLLAEMLSGQSGSGTCHAWANFLIAMWKSHGDNGGRMVEILVQSPSPTSQRQKRKTGFLVKNFDFDAPHPKNPYSFTYPFTVKCHKREGVKGQNNPNPPPVFLNHYIVIAAGQYFDPSYGSPIFPNKLEWENNSIDGLTNGYHEDPGDYAGYRKSDPILRKIELLEFTTF